MRTFAFAAFVALGCGAAPAAPSPEADLSVLFVGNSLTYTNDLPDMVRRLLETHGEAGDVQVESVALPNFGLIDHWSEGSALESIRAGGWDYVVLQQGPSATEGRPSLLDYSQRFATEVDRSGGRLALYMVWPSMNRFFDFAGVSDSYRTAAEQTGGLLFPAGEAWREAWALDADLDLYGPDGFHPSQLGTHLAALVIYQQLSGRDPRSLPSEIVTSAGTVSLSIELAKVLHEAAAAANAKFARP